jgi:hypothetical protein
MVLKGRQIKKLCSTIRSLKECGVSDSSILNGYREAVKSIKENNAGIQTSDIACQMILAMRS